MSAPAGRAAAGLPLVAVIGRPNAGKSMLFNRITRSQRAVVDAEPGVTRDRNIAEARAGGKRFLVVDTGGFDPDVEGGLEGAVRAQSELAIAAADAIIFVVDGRAGVAPADREVAQLLRRSRKPVWLAVNKLDTPNLDDEVADYFDLGLERVLPISAAHGRGVDELLEQLLAVLEAPAEAAEPGGAGAALAVALVGRPNVGKSSLLNRLVGYDRSIVTPVPGTTRDAIDTPVSFRGHEILLVDTAGVRRRARIDRQLERVVAMRAFRALERSRVAVLVLDAGEGLTDQDARIASYAWERGRGLVLAVNKCDLLEGREAPRRLGREIERRVPFLGDVPLLFVSAQTGAGVDSIFPAVLRVAENHARELPTHRLNEVIHAATAATAPPSVRGRRPAFQYAVQTFHRPPVVTLFCSAPDLVQEAYTRYLTNRLREAFKLEGTPVRIRYRKRVQTKGRGRAETAAPPARKPDSKRHRRVRRAHRNAPRD